MPQWTLEPDNDNAVTLLRDGRPVATGHRHFDDPPILDPWTTLVDRDEHEAARQVEMIYEARFGSKPVRPRR